MSELIQSEIETNRRSVAFDSYDITVKQLYDMILENIIDIAPEYQRHFNWDSKRQSQLIESLLLGIPVPSLYMATNKDASWEVVDGVQRLTTIINFLHEKTTLTNTKFTKLRLDGLEKLSSINGLTFEELPRSVQLIFQTRPVRVTVLNDRSDFAVRYDLFERLNTGGVTLHPQEIRNCVFLGEFNDFLKECANNVNFRSVVKMTSNAERSGSYEELVLRFFAYYEDQNEFVHGVTDFLNKYMQRKTKVFTNKKELNSIFSKTFLTLKENLPNGIVRLPRKNLTPVILYEAIATGVARNIKKNKTIIGSKLKNLLNDNQLKDYTTGATNTKSILDKRISYVSEYISK
ncbi:DUF262 domain-containing protein [Leptospira levettii]|uniref:DUF262 domain-containing protein n=1 Tax=Leptospira levettii TaxID=2023178 RepID=UPI001AEFCEF9|nr:DUF262 domain-containing protein [Leptospira levettii]